MAPQNGEKISFHGPNMYERHVELCMASCCLPQTWWRCSQAVRLLPAVELSGVSVSLARACLYAFMASHIIIAILINVIAHRMFS